MFNNIHCTLKCYFKLYLFTNSLVYVYIYISHPLMFIPAFIVDLLVFNKIYFASRAGHMQLYLYSNLRIIYLTHNVITMYTVRTLMLLLIAAALSVGDENGKYALSSAFATTKGK